MPRGDIREAQDVPACHVERVRDTRSVAANHQRNTSCWNIISRSGVCDEESDRSGQVTEEPMANVRCYAGTSYPERPVAFEWEGRWLEVTELLRRARTPEGLRFDVLAEDGRRYRLDWDTNEASWSIIVETAGRSVIRQ